MNEDNWEEVGNMIAQHSQVPAAMDRQLEVLYIRKDGGLFLGASQMNTRYWKGSIWFYANPDSAPDPALCTAGLEIGSGVTDMDAIDEDIMIISTDSGSLEILSLQDNSQRFQHILSANQHDDIASSVSVNCRRNSAVSASYDNTVKLWELTTLQPLYSYKAHYDIVWNVCYHPTDSALFTSCSRDGRVILWDTRKTKPATVIDFKNISQPTCLAWQPSSEQKLAVGSESGQIEFRDLRTPSESAVSFTPHKRTIHRLAFCAESPGLLASVSEDCSVKVNLLEGPKFTEIYQDTFEDFVHGLAWRNASQFYTCSWDKQVKGHQLLNSKSQFAMETNGSPSYADKLKNTNGDV